MIYIYRCLFYSVRNLIYYREVRDDPVAVRELLQRFEACSELESEGDARLQAMKDIMTEFLLSSVGLTTVNDPRGRIPHGVWLTAVQRDSIVKVSEFGYRAGLR